MPEEQQEQISGNGHAAENGGPLSHILPAKLLVLIWAILIVMTVLTVAASKVDFGSFNLWVALGIATVKATLVAMYYMHLRYERPWLGIIIVSALVFVMLFVSITLLDTQAYMPNLIDGYAPRIIQ